MSETKLFKGTIKPEHHVEFAFNDGTMDLFCFSDAFNIPCERALDCMTIYEEVNMRCTREFLIAHTTAVQNLMMANPVNIYDVKKLNDQLKERLDFIIYPELIKKLASVYFFDETENPYKYDFQYGKVKIARWNKADIDVFFSMIPIKKLIPSYNLSGIDLKTYSKVLTAVDKIHLKDIIGNLSPDQLNSDLFKILFSTVNSEYQTESA